MTTFCTLITPSPPQPAKALIDCSSVQCRLTPVGDQAVFAWSLPCITAPVELDSPQGPFEVIDHDLSTRAR